jgi:hypothetical protein
MIIIVKTQYRHSFGAGVGSLLIVDLFQRLDNLNSTNLEGYLLGNSFLR